jgi:CubicO group peptidase (beta-lactamase class C family)
VYLQAHIMHCRLATLVSGLIAFGALGLITPAARAETLSPELTADDVGGVVDPLMTQWIDQHQGPGAVVVVVTREAPLFAQGYGFADRAARRPFTAAATLVRPGSISKLFTGIAVMQLVDQGALDPIVTSTAISISTFRPRRAACRSHCAGC